MRCAECKVMHEQFKNYKGRWMCWRPGDTMGRIICETPVADFDDKAAHNRVLEETPTPQWCPFKQSER